LDISGHVCIQAAANNPVQIRGKTEFCPALAPKPAIEIEIGRM
jgi:hypothetical protein